ncbi:Voltage-dependent calcium channel subunit alpha-2/delta-4, partial [Blattella germanica]
LLRVHEWAQQLGEKLWQVGDAITGWRELKQKFNKQVQYKFVSKDDRILVQEIADSIYNMTRLKVSAVKRIVKNAETMALQLYNKTKKLDINHTYFGTKADDPEGDPLHHVIGLDVTENSHFRGEPVNLTYSSVHIPTNVYNRGVIWEHSTDNVDMFDCRMRLWYIEASTSPKDVIILVDNSGSMAGKRHEIARHLVNNILETLGSNDFVTVLKFNNRIKSVVECFNDTLVQANLGNVRDLKLAIKSLKAEEMANFELALTTAFDLLQRAENESEGASCNRAIMLITDGLPDYYKEIFDKYNGYFAMGVRMFMYLIGEEDPVAREMQWIACKNNGYYVPLKTSAEVREKVLRYMPVMSRPLVLAKERPINWSPVYADVAVSSSFLQIT